MKKVIDYRITFDRHIDVIESNVKKMIKDGWQPIGGISSFFETYSGSTSYFFSQAMVKYEECISPQSNIMTLERAKEIVYSQCFEMKKPPYTLSEKEMYLAQWIQGEFGYKQCEKWSHEVDEIWDKINSK